MLAGILDIFCLINLMPTSTVFFLFEKSIKGFPTYVGKPYFIRITGSVSCITSNSKASVKQLISKCFDCQCTLDRDPMELKILIIKFMG